MATAHCQLMEASRDLPPHDVYFPNADDTTALEGSRDLVETRRPDLLPIIRRQDNHQSFISAAKLKAAVGWYTSSFSQDGAAAVIGYRVLAVQAAAPQDATSHDFGGAAGPPPGLMSAPQVLGAALRDASACPG